MLLRIIAVCTIAWLSSSALAQQGTRAQRREARAHFDQATTHYNLGRFEEALAEYTRAYEVFPSPRLLFNIGQCHRALNNHERAIFFLESFFREAGDLSAEERRLAEDLLAESRTALAAQRAEQRAEPPPPPREEPAPPPPPREAAETVVPAEPPEPPAPIDEPAPRSPQFYEEGWFWGALLGSAAAIGVVVALGVYFGTQTQLPSGSLGTVDWR